MLKSSIKKQWSLAPLLFLCLSLAAGCANVGPYVEPPEPDPEPAGPGLFTGEKGYYSAGGDKQEPKAESDTIPSDPSDFAEFEAYQRWKTEGRNSDEYREFQQWQQYKKWKSEQDKSK